jgi:hypothetical protein
LSSTSDIGEMACVARRFPFGKRDKWCGSRGEEWSMEVDIGWRVHGCWLLTGDVTSAKGCRRGRDGLRESKECMAIRWPIIDVPPKSSNGAFLGIQSSYAMRQSCPTRGSSMARRLGNGGADPSRYHMPESRPRQRAKAQYLLELRNIDPWISKGAWSSEVGGRCPMYWWHLGCNASKRYRE